MKLRISLETGTTNLGQVGFGTSFLFDPYGHFDILISVDIKGTHSHGAIRMLRSIPLNRLKDVPTNRKDLVELVQQQLFVFLLNLSQKGAVHEIDGCRVGI